MCVLGMEDVVVGKIEDVRALINEDDTPGSAVKPLANVWSVGQHEAKHVTRSLQSTVGSPPGTCKHRQQYHYLKS